MCNVILIENGGDDKKLKSYYGRGLFLIILFYCLFCLSQNYYIVRIEN